MRNATKVLIFAALSLVPLTAQGQCAERLQEIYRLHGDGSASSRSMLVGEARQALTCDLRMEQRAWVYDRYVAALYRLGSDSLGIDVTTQYFEELPEGVDSSASARIAMARAGFEARAGREFESATFYRKAVDLAGALTLEEQLRLKLELAYVYETQRRYQASRYLAASVLGDIRADSTQRDLHARAAARFAYATARLIEEQREDLAQLDTALILIGASVHYAQQHDAYNLPSRYAHLAALKDLEDEHTLAERYHNLAVQSAGAAGSRKEIFVRLRRAQYYLQHQQLDEAGRDLTLAMHRGEVEGVHEFDTPLAEAWAELHRRRGEYDVAEDVLAREISRLGRAMTLKLESGSRIYEQLSAIQQARENRLWRRFLVGMGICFLLGTTIGVMTGRIRHRSRPAVPPPTAPKVVTLPLQTLDRDNLGTIQVDRNTLPADVDPFRLVAIRFEGGTYIMQTEPDDAGLYLQLDEAGAWQLITRPEILARELVSFEPVV